MKGQEQNKNKFIILNLLQLTSENFNNWKLRFTTIHEEKKIKVTLEKQEKDLKTAEKRMNLK